MCAPCCGALPAPPTSPIPPPCALLLLPQYCDRGTLNDAIDRGWLRESPAEGAPLDARSVLATAQVDALLCDGSPERIGRRARGQQASVPAMSSAACPACPVTAPTRGLSAPSLTQDIASALAFLHSRSMIHGDLSGGNVLLVTDGDDPRGFHAKVGMCADELCMPGRGAAPGLWRCSQHSPAAHVGPPHATFRRPFHTGQVSDFGVSRLLGSIDCQTATFGTVRCAKGRGGALAARDGQHWPTRPPRATWPPACLCRPQPGRCSHMPPELLKEGQLSRATDCYSWGVLCWEVRWR